MTYNVFGGTLNLAQSINHCHVHATLMTFSRSCVQMTRSQTKFCSETTFSANALLHYRVWRPCPINVSLPCPVKIVPCNVFGGTLNSINQFTMEAYYSTVCL